MKSFRIFIAVTMLCAIVLCGSESGFSHCQIPCGIFDDQMRFEMIAEDIETIEKSMKEISKLSDSPTPDYNQLIRWVNNKDVHAEKIADTVTYYFLAQRIKPVSSDSKDYKKYLNNIELLHRLLVLSMKSKQEIDLDLISKMRETLNRFESSYKME